MTVPNALFVLGIGFILVAATCLSFAGVAIHHGGKVPGWASMTCIILAAIGGLAILASHLMATA